MLLEGKAAMTVATLAMAGILAAWNSLGPWVQDLVLAAAAIAAIKVIGGAVRAFLARAREVHEAVTSQLPARVSALEEMARGLQGELKATKETLQAYGAAEAAAVRGAIESQRRPRMARSSDPGVRTGWRE